MSSLYHYTSAAGLEGMTRYKSLWSTDFRFLNDSREFYHGLSIFEARIAEIAASDPSRFAGGLSDFIAKRIKGAGMTIPGVFANDFIVITSLSEKRDLLSQWRGYNDGKGFVVGIDFDWLEACAHAQGFSLAKVIYDPAAQSSMIDGLIDDISMKLSGLTDPMQRLKVIAQWVRRTLAPLGEAAPL